MQHGHPLAFVSKTLEPKNLGLSINEKEYLAILLALKDLFVACSIFYKNMSRNFEIPSGPEEYYSSPT